MTNADECFPNYPKMEQPRGKGEYEEGGRGKVVSADRRRKD
jgi:hypothetical protein